MRILDQYKYSGDIGEGYFSIVKKYTHILTGNKVAVKQLKKEFNENPDYIHRFQKEIEILNELQECENIIELIENGLIEGANFYIMPYATTNLYEYIKKYNPLLDYEKRVNIFDQILSAIKFSHSKGYLHRDLDPRNVLLLIDDKNIKVKVSDFGLGKDIQSMSAFTKSEIGNYGHIFYVAPEQREKLKNASFQSDIYSLGKLLNFIMTGKDPDIIYPCDFTTVISKATQPGPEFRYSNIEEFESIYTRIKNLKNSNEGNSIEDFAFTPDKKPNSDEWLKFHDFSVKGNYRSHVYSGYIYPIVKILSDTDNLLEYYSVVGGAFVDFFNTFTERIHDCLQTTGWPFPATESFGILFRNIFLTVTESSIKAACLQELWSLAYENDQWRVQSTLNKLLDGETIPDEIRAEFALYILDSHAQISEEQFRNLRIPKIIYNAILQKCK